MDRSPCSILWLPNLRQGPCNCQEPCQALVNFHSPVMPHTLYMYEANFNFLKDRFYFVVLDIEKMYILKKKNLALFVSRCPPTACLSPTSVGCPQPTCCPRTSVCHLPPPTRGHSPPSWPFSCTSPGVSQSVWRHWDSTCHLSISAHCMGKQRGLQIRGVP